MDIVVIILIVLVIFGVIRWAIDASQHTALLKEQLKVLREIKELLQDHKKNQ